MNLDSNALLYELRSLDSYADIESFSRIILKSVASIVSLENKSALRKMGIKPIERSLKKHIMRNFSVFTELDNLKLFNVSISIVRSVDSDSSVDSKNNDNNTDTENTVGTENTVSTMYTLSPLITYPPSSSKIPTPDVAEVKVVIERWIEENNLFLVMPFFALSAQVFAVLPTVKNAHIRIRKHF